MKRTLLFAAVISLITVVACKKDSTVNSTPTLKGVWSLDSIVTKDYLNNVLQYSNSQSGDGAKLDFQDNGNLVVTNANGVPGATQTMTYSIAGSYVSFFGGNYEIRDLNASTVSLIRRDPTSAVEYEDVYLKLKR